MKLRIYIYILFLSSLLGCQNFLNVKPQGKILPKTEDEYAAVLNYRLNNFESGAYDYMLNNAEMIAKYEAYADDLNANVTIGNLPIYAGTDFNKNYGLYKDLYAFIKDCNIIIEAMEEKTSSHARLLLASCTSIKGICYYNLMRNYCKSYDPATAETDLGLCIIDRFDVDYTPERSSLKTTGSFVVSTLKKAVSYGVTDDKYVFTADITKAFLAKALFWLEEWDDALEICRKLAEIYPLESITEYGQSINSEFDMGPGIIIRNRTNNNNSAGSLIKGQAVSDMRSRPVSRDLIKLYAPYNDKDIRYAKLFGPKRQNLREPYGSIRSAELYLMMAECHAHMGEDQAALDIINNLRSNRIEGHVPYTLENLPEVDENAVIKVDALGKPLTKLTQAILNERRMEMCMEGDRWFELKRNGEPEFTVITDHIGIWQKYTTKSYMYTFPINKDDVDLKDYLKQNDGYVEYL